MPMIFKRYCTQCKTRVPEDRLRRGADTCSTECKDFDRRSQRRYQKALAKDKILRSPWLRKLLHGARRTAPGDSGSAASTPKRPVGTLPEYRAYVGAKARCQNPNNTGWKHYGGRGIEFRFDSFRSFYELLGPRPDKHSLDRIDNDGHYEAGNVRWATARQQLSNRGRLRKCSGKFQRTLGPTEPKFNLEERLLA